VVDFSIAPVGPGGHGLEEACAADGRIQVVASGPADYQGDQGVGIGGRESGPVVGFDQVRMSERMVRSGPCSYLLRSSRTSTREISAGMEESLVTRSCRVVKRTWKSDENRDSFLSLQGKRSCLAM